MIFRNLSWFDWKNLLMDGTLLGLVIVWEFLFVAMFFFPKVRVQEPNLFVRLFEMVFLGFVLVLVLKRFWGNVNDYEKGFE